MNHATEENPQALIDFLTICKDYCALIEQTTDYTRADFLRRAYVCLPEIFCYLSQMPDSSSEESLEWQHSYAQMISDETVSYYEERVRLLLGEELDLFLVYPVGSSRQVELQPERLSRLLLQIYREVGSLLLILREDAGELFVETLSVLSVAFDAYLGDALLSVLRILHKHKDAEDQPNDRSIW